MIVVKLLLRLIICPAAKNNAFAAAALEQSQSFGVIIETRG